MQQAQHVTVLAATAEEMSGRVQNLQQLIGLSKVDGGDGKRPAATTFHPSPRRPAPALALSAPSLLRPQAADSFTRFRGDATVTVEERPC